MRTWYKYLLNEPENSTTTLKDRTPDEHRRTMGGFSAQEGYGSKEEFFRTYFHNGPYHYHCKDEFLREHLPKEKDGLSVGCGRCINELLLMEDGYKIICSDLEFYCQNETMRIFPDLQFEKLDIATSQYRSQVDYVISLGILYLFDEQECANVFSNVAKSLKPGGIFILDPGGAEDHYKTYMIDEYICKIEARIKQLVRHNSNGNKKEFVKKHHGYRSKNQEIIKFAEKAGFKLEALKGYDPVNESTRSFFMRRWPKSLQENFGRDIPYARLFKFIKVGT